MRSQLVSNSSKLTVVTIALLGTVAAFVLGARAGAALNGHASSMSVARVPILSLVKSTAAP